MAEIHSVVVVKFPDASSACQALSVLKVRCRGPDRPEVRRDRRAHARRRAAHPGGTDNIALVGTVSGSLIGMLIGVLGGPWAFSSAGAPAP